MGASIERLQKDTKEIKTLHGIMPICTSCKKIRDDKGYWNHIEVYFRELNLANFTDGICPECAKKYIWNLFNN